MNRFRCVPFLSLVATMLFTPSMASATWTGVTIVTQVRPSTSNSGIFVTTSAPVINPESCSNSAQYMIPTSSPVYKELTAVLLSALIAERTINVWVNGCAPGGSHTFPKIDDVIIY